MAQVKPKFKWFERDWQDRVNRAASALRDCEERWLRSDEPFPARTVVAVMLRIFASPFARYIRSQEVDLWRLSWDELTLLVGTPESESARLCPHQPAAAHDDLLGAWCALLERAAECWSATPGDPSPEALVQAMVNDLVGRRFVAIKYD